MFVRRSTYNEVVDELNEVETENDDLMNEVSILECRKSQLEDALREITEQVTGSPNATVVRMARIAEEALEALYEDEAKELAASVSDGIRD